jgi:hypothetical protein
VSSGSESRSSSPERYLSDYDDEGEGPMNRGERMAGPDSGRMRRGSEGWEVRAGVAGWDLESHSALEHRPVWEREGRYNLYVPEQEA